MVPENHLKSRAMDPARIQQLLQPFLAEALADSFLVNISTYIDLLLRWNARISLTAVRDPEHIVTRHFGESLFAARHLFPSQAPEPRNYVDLGSGAGFPGLPIKLYAPAVQGTLIESNHKKAAFLGEVIRALGIIDATVFAERGERFPQAASDLVTLRAVERFDTALPVAANLMRTQGRLALLIGGSQLDRVPGLLPDFRWQDPITVPLSAARILLIGTKDEPK
jgi:16S rRNA (guanine527-N7)-methyltransferase